VDPNRHPFSQKRTSAFVLLALAIGSAGCGDSSLDLVLESRLNRRTFTQIRSDSTLLGHAIGYGRDIFARQDCSGCHGARGEGTPRWCPPLNDDEWIWGGSDDEIFTTIKFGVRQLEAYYAVRPGTRFSVMPRFDRQLSKEQISLLADHVRALSSGQPTTDTSRALFRSYCAACHGPEGDGANQRIGSPSLVRHVWIQSGNPAKLEEYIATAGYLTTNHSPGPRSSEFRDSGMPNWGDNPLGLRDGQIRALTLYIKSLRNSR
jgi:cbb3-type cytochrome c oxidase subunit III